MDYATRQLLVLAQKLRDEIRSLRMSASHLSDSLENFTKALHEDRQSREKTSQTQPSISISDFRANQPIRIQADTYSRDKKSGWRYIKRALYIIGIFAGVGYTLLTWNIWLEQISATNAGAKQAEYSRKSLNETIKQTRREYRAWVTATIAAGASFDSGQPMVIPIRIANAGKTAAKDVSGDIALYVMSKGENPVFLYGEEGSKSRYPSYHYSARIIMQGDVQDNPLVVTQHGKQGTGNLIWSKELQAKFETRDLWLIVYGRLTYRDIFRTEHWQTFCYMPRNPSLTIGGTGNKREHVGNDACERYEDMDDN